MSYVVRTSLIQRPFYSIKNNDSSVFKLYIKLVGDTVYLLKAIMKISFSEEGQNGVIFEEVKISQQRVLLSFISFIIFLLSSLPF